MIAKVTVTTRCNSKCRSCPVWKTPQDDMSFDNFKIIYDKLNNDDYIEQIIINSTGELFSMPGYQKYIKYMEDNKIKYTAIQTNGALMDRVPKLDNVVISFNGTNKKNYEYMTRLDFGQVVSNIKSKYAQIDENAGCAEIHCLLCELNEGPEDEFYDLWHDFPGKLRISYKYENQFVNDYTIKKHVKNRRFLCN
jgi:molybdenum cofactor biosynthesis enzyme MoaA